MALYNKLSALYQHFVRNIYVCNMRLTSFEMYVKFGQVTRKSLYEADIFDEDITSGDRNIL